MPITKSAIKRARQNPVRRDRRAPFKTHMRTMMKKYTQLVKGGKASEAKAMVAVVYKAIDTAAKKGVIHRNTASRKKSLVARMLASK